MDPLAVPERLMTSIRALGPAGSGWLEDLPGILASLAADSLLTGVNDEAIWQWAFIERVSTGLFLFQLGHRQEAGAYLAVADRLSAAHTIGQ